MTADTPSSSHRSEAPTRLWIGSLVIDCTDLPRMMRFWAEALHYVPREPPTEEGVFLTDPLGHGPNLNLNVASEGPLDEYRLHIDLYARNPLEEVDRLLGLGATRKWGPEKGHDFVTLADPDGNLFDVIDVNWPGSTPDWWFGRKV